MRAFASDFHLGTKDCNEIDLMSFFDLHKSVDEMFILGDFIDIWKLSTMADLPVFHSLFIEHILTRKYPIYYIIGNHDEWIDNLCGNYNNLTIDLCWTIRIAGKKFLLTHGHQYDPDIKHFGWLARLLTGIADKFRKDRHFSMAEYLKKKPKAKEDFIKRSVADLKNYDGIICGHTHIPEMQKIDGKYYINTGDFVHHSSFLTEEEGNFRLYAFENHKAKLLETMEIE